MSRLRELLADYRVGQQELLHRQVRRLWRLVEAADAAGVALRYRPAEPLSLGPRRLELQLTVDQVAAGLGGADAIAAAELVLDRALGGRLRLTIRGFHG